MLKYGFGRIFGTLWILAQISTLAFGQVGIATGDTNVQAKLSQAAQSWYRLLTLDGNYLNGRMSLTSLRAMEVDSSQAIRMQSDLYRQEALLLLNPRLQSSEPVEWVTIEDMYGSGYLRKGLAIIVAKSVEDWKLPTTEQDNYRLRNRISFVANVLYRMELILKQGLKARQLDGKLVAALEQEIQSVKTALLEVLPELELHAQLVQAGDAHWFELAKGLGNASQLNLGTYSVTETETTYLRYDGGIEVVIPVASAPVPAVPAEPIPAPAPVSAVPAVPQIPEPVTARETIPAPSPSASPLSDLPSILEEAGPLVVPPPVPRDVDIERRTTGSN